jgi:Na+-transporting NADH:ubiquinone oxidoreductase subunit NqrB
MSWNSVLVLVLIVLSGFADSLGFVYAAKIWQAEQLSWPDVGRSALGWAVGITLYVISLKYMARLGVTSAEMQTAVWFAMTIIGVVIFSGRFFSWPRLEQLVATLVLLGLGWLLVRTGE